MANPEIHSLEELRTADNPNYLRIAQRRNAVWRAGEIVNKAVPHTFAQVTSPIQTSGAYAEYGVGVISQARPNPEYYPLITQLLVPFQPGERSVLPLLEAYPYVTFGFALDKRFCYTPLLIDQSFDPRQREIELPEPFQEREIREQDLAKGLRLLSRGEPFQRFSEMDLSKRDFLRLVNLRLLELQDPNQVHRHPRPTPPEVVVIKVLKTPPPNEFEAAVALTFDGQIVTIPEYRTVKRNTAHPHPYRPGQTQIETVQAYDPHTMGHLPDHQSHHTLGDHRFK
jgi:hypothetical protein